VEIHNHGQNSRIHFQAKNPQPQSQVEGSSSVDRSNEVQPRKLAERLEGDAKVRERLLVEVKAKFLAGEYVTRSAVEEAAQNIVD
jgi:hypothetical protein